MIYDVAILASWHALLKNELLFRHTYVRSYAGQNLSKEIVESITGGNFIRDNLFHNAEISNIKILETITNRIRVVLYYYKIITYFVFVMTTQS